MSDAVLPRRLRPGIAAAYPTLYQVEDPLRDGLTAEVGEMSDCVEVATGAAEKLTLPDFTDEERELFSRADYASQAGTSFVVAGILADDEELRGSTGVQPEHLIEPMKKESQLLRLQAGMEQVQNDGADGKLMAGALFDFYEEKVLDFFARKISAAQGPERPALLGELAGVHVLLRQMTEAQAAAGEATARKEDALHTELGDARDELAFVTARQILQKGAAPDEETLAGARRHSELSASQAEARPAPKERRKKPRRE